MSIINTIKLGAVLLAGSTIFAMPVAHAQCTTAAWSSTTGNPATGGPLDDTPVLRKSGACGLAPATAGNSFVVESTNHDAEGVSAPLRGRFFVYTGVSAGTPTIFRAMDADSAGNAVVEIAYDAVQQNFDFTVNGSTLSTAAGSAPRDRWVNVQFVYEATEAFTAGTQTGGADEVELGAGLTAGASAVEAVQLGVIASNGASGNLYFDEYESSRAVDTGGGSPYTMVCDGDADGDGSYGLPDIFGVIDEFLRGQGDGTRNLAAGVPDYNGDGVIDLTDIFGVVDEFLAAQAGSPGSGCN